MGGRPFQKGHDPRRVNPRPAGSTWKWERKPDAPGSPRPGKITDSEEFRAMYLNPEIPFSAIARSFGVSENTVANTAKRLGLGYRMPLLRAAGLGPYAKGRKRRVA